jgi:hypothetical protein
MRLFNEALNFHVTKRLPGGSWDRWLTECFIAVERTFSFQCTWISLVGMTAGMLETRGDFANYEQVAKSRFKRSGEQRFLIYFVALSEALVGASDEQLRSTYRGKSGSRLRQTIPAHVLQWPQNRKTLDILKQIRPLAHIPIPSIVRETDVDFFAYLLYGYYVTSRNGEALALLLEQYRLHPESLVLKSLHGVIF